MLWLRRGWLIAIAGAVVLAGGSALVMRFELLDPHPTLAPALYGHALALHGLLALGGLVATVLAIPTLVMTPGRGAVVLGALALGLWAAAIALLFVALGSLGSAGLSPPNTLLVLAASLGLGAAQIAVSLPANADRASRAQLAVAACGLVAIAIIVIPLLAREVPTTASWLLATSAFACGLIPDAVKRIGWPFTLIAIAPCLALAWTATALVHGADPRDFDLHDTVFELSPLPVTGGALLGAMLLAVTRSRLPQRGLAVVAAALITAGAGLTSIGFYLLGSRGLPRRYFAYLPEFQPLQILVGVAAAIAVIGGLVALEAFRRGSRPSGVPLKN
jgi:heme/copper-type cytochrome/quinol oxidase subunit 1